MLDEEWFAHCGAGGSAKPRTVLDTCIEDVGHLRGAGREQAAADARGRFQRWVYPDARLARTALRKLTPKTIDDGRLRAAQSAARRVPAQADGSAPVQRSASALNRDMTALRAALNLALANGHATSDHAWRTKLRPHQGCRGATRDLPGRRVASGSDCLCASGSRGPLVCPGAAAASARRQGAGGLVRRAPGGAAGWQGQDRRRSMHQPAADDREFSGRAMPGPAPG